MAVQQTTILTQKFYARPALSVARDLLGKVLVRRIGQEIRAGVITEVEAYIGPQDRACHAYRGCTPRTAVMFGPAGCWYVYCIYGMHWMLNIVTSREGHPSAVLIRGAGEWSGPGRVTRALEVDGMLNGVYAERRSGLWIEDRSIVVPSGSIERTPRIGVAYAGEWARKPYRFVWIP